MCVMVLAVFSFVRFLKLEKMEMMKENNPKKRTNAEKRRIF